MIILIEVQVVKQLIGEGAFTMWITLIGIVLIAILILNLGYTIFDHE